MSDIIEIMGQVINSEWGWHDNPESGHKIARAALRAALEAGWKLVPIEPTPDMIWTDYHKCERPADYYKTMLAAAPDPLND